MGPQRLCILLSGVNEFMGRGCMVRNVAVRKSQEESLQGSNETPEMGAKHDFRFFCFWGKKKSLHVV